MTNKEVGIKLKVDATGQQQLSEVEKGLGAAGEKASDLAERTGQAAGKLGQLGRAADDVGRSAQESARGFDQIDTAAKGAAEEVGHAAGKLGEVARTSAEVGRVAQDSARGFDQLDSAAKGLTGQAAQAADKIGDLGRAASDTRGQAGQLANALEGVQSQVKQAGASVDTLGKELDGAFRTLGIRAANDVRKEIDELNAAMARIRGTNPFSEDTARAAEALKVRLAQLDAELGKLPAQSSAAAAGVRNVGAASSGAADGIERATKTALALGSALLGINSASEVARSVLSTASAYENLQVRLEQTLGSQKAANEQFERIKQLAIETPYEVSALTDTYIRLTNFGLKPTMQQMMAIADTAAIAGGGTESLTRVTLALGQAWAKTRLQGDEILQLTEAGVPVWDLLAKATGKNVTELQALSEAGALGRDVILKLFDAIGEKNAGASSKLMATFAGTVSNAKDAMAQFFDMIGKSGVLEYLTKKLQEALNEFDRMKNSGELQRRAEAIANGFLDVARGLEAAAEAAKKLAPVLELALAAWAGSKAIAIATNMWGIAKAVCAAGVASGAAAAPIATMGASAATASVGVGMLAGAMRTLGRAVGIGLVVEAVSLLVGKWLDSRRAAEEAAEAAKKAAKDTADALAPKLEGPTAEEQFKKTKESIRDVSAELDEFKKRLPQLESDLSGLTGEGLANAAKSTIENLRAVKAPADEAKKAITTIAERAAEVLGVELPSQAAKLSASFKGVQAEFSTLVGQLPNLGLTARQQADVVGQALSKMIESASTKKDFEALEETIRRFGATGKISSTQVAEALDTAAARATKLRDAIDDATPGLQGLREATRKVGGDFEQLTKGMSDGFRKGLTETRAFHDEIVRSGIAAERASPQLAAALDHQIRTAKTREEIEAARKATDEFRASGKLLNTDYGDTLDKIRKKVEEISPALKQAKKDAELLQVELGALSDKPKRSVEEMLTAYERLKSGGKATAEELKQAFTTVAVEAIKANKGVVPQWVALEAKMRDVVVVGEEFGNSSVQWAAQAAGSTGQVTEAVKSAAGAYREMGAAAKVAGQQASAAAQEAARAEAERRIIVDSMRGDPAAMAARNAQVKSTIKSDFSIDTKSGTIGSTYTPPPDQSGDYEWVIENNVGSWQLSAAGSARRQQAIQGRNDVIREAYRRAGMSPPGDGSAAGLNMMGLPPEVRAFLNFGASGPTLRDVGGAAGSLPTAVAMPGPAPSSEPPTRQLQPITFQFEGQQITGTFDPTDVGPLQAMLRELAAGRARTG